MRRHLFLGEAHFQKPRFETLDAVFLRVRLNQKQRDDPDA